MFSPQIPLLHSALVAQRHCCVVAELFGSHTPEPSGRSVQHPFAAKQSELFVQETAHARLPLGSVTQTEPDLQQDVAHACAVAQQAPATHDCPDEHVPFGTAALHGFTSGVAHVPWAEHV